MAGPRMLKPLLQHLTYASELRVFYLLKLKVLL